MANKDNGFKTISARINQAGCCSLEDFRAKLAKIFGADGYLGARVNGSRFEIEMQVAQEKLRQIRKLKLTVG